LQSGCDAALAYGQDLDDNFATMARQMADTEADTGLKGIERRKAGGFDVDQGLAGRYD
jgi:hypothetical protein